MTRVDYYTLGLSVLNLYLLMLLMNSFTISNITAIYDYRMVAGYVTLGAFIAGIILILRNLSRVVTYLSGNVPETSTFIRPLAIETFIVLILFIIISISNETIFYLFNKVV